MINNKLKNLSMDEDSLTFLLNFALKNLAEERDAALRHHDTMSAVIDGAGFAPDGMSALEIQVIAKDLSEAITNFLNSANQSTEQIIKLAKLISDYVLKVDNSGLLSDEDRLSIEELVKEASTEIDTNKEVINKLKE